MHWKPASFLVCTVCVFIKDELTQQLLFLWTLAKQGLRLRNFRQLALASDIGRLGPESAWDHAECLTAVVRQYVEAVTGKSLLQAAERGDAQLVRELLEKPHDPNAAATLSLATPLLAASEKSHLEVVQCLLDAGADTEKVAINDATPLRVAAQRGHQAVVQRLLDAGADTENADSLRRSPLHFAVLKGHQAVVQCLLEAGADTEATVKGWTSLHFAAHQGHQAIVNCLLDAGADKAKTNPEGSTPLHLATQQGYQAVEQCLLDARATKR